MMRKDTENKKENKKNHKSVRCFIIFINLCGFLIVAGLSFLAVYHFAQALALHPTDTVDIGESIVFESEGALTESRIDGVTDIFQLSEELASLDSTHVEWTKIAEDPSQTGFFCIAEDKSSECVYNIDQNDICNLGYNLKNFNYIWVDSFSGSFYTVMNISGRVVDLSDYYILVRDSSSNLASRLIINCYEAEEVLLKNTILTGTLIAPSAHVTYEKTVVNGQVYAETSAGVRSSYRDISFTGYETLISALKKANLENECVRQWAVDYLRNNFPLIYGDVSGDYIPGETDLLRVTSMQLDGVTSSNISNDLKYFKKLQYFSCTNSKIENIDFSGLEFLSEISISSSTVTNLKFGELKSLLKLNAEKNVIQNLDVSLCPELVSLSYEGTAVKSLVLPKNSKIIYINCSDTDFRGFTQDNIAALSELLYLEAENNKHLGYIELSALPKLKKVNITNCGINDINFAECKNLYYAKCSNNDFTAINISNAPALIYFEAYSSVLKEIDATGVFKRGFAGLYVYDEVKIIDNDPPEVVVPEVSVTPGTSAAPGTSATPGISATPGTTAASGSVAPAVTASIASDAAAHAP